MVGEVEHIELVHLGGECSALLLHGLYEFGEDTHTGVDFGKVLGDGVTGEAEVGQLFDEDGFEVVGEDTVTTFEAYVLCVLVA